MLDIVPHPLAFTTRDGVQVIGICALLDHLFGVDGWFGLEPETTHGSVARWLNANAAHYHSWSGPSFLRLAEEARAVDAAQKAGRAIVVVESLS